MANEFTESPSYYDGSTAPADWSQTDWSETEELVLTPEARKFISANPYYSHTEEK